MTPRPPSTVHSAQDSATVAHVLAAAFDGDPLFRWLFPGPGHRGALERWWAHLAAAAAVRSDAELWHAPDEGSAALWYAPRGLDPPERREAASSDGAGGSAVSFDELVAELVGDRIDEVRTAFAAIAAAHLTEPHWYLAAVGTEPRLQGRGSGARLLRPVLERCDAEGLGAYLESSNPRNVPFYHRLGFVVVGALTLASGAAAMTCMWRPPR